MAPRARLCLCHVAALFESDRERDRERERERSRDRPDKQELRGGPATKRPRRGAQLAYGPRPKRAYQT